MKVLIISDSHGLEDELETIAKRHEDEADLMIHCGDSELDAAHPALTPYHTVKAIATLAAGFRMNSFWTPVQRKFWPFTGIFTALNSHF